MDALISFSVTLCDACFWYHDLQEYQKEFQDEMLSLLLWPQFAEVPTGEVEGSINPLWSNLWSVNPQVLKMQMVNYLLSNGQSAYQQVLRICCDLKVENHRLMANTAYI